MRNLKVAVTGASGYLGRMVIARLESEPAVQSILGLDVRPPAYTGKKLEFRAADVRTADFVRDFQGLDAVYHLAFVVQPPRRMAMAEIDAINVGGSRRVFDQAIAAGVGRIVYASSVTVYGVHPDNPPVLTEASPLRPNPGWYYSRAKGQVEAYLDELERRHPHLIAIRLRLSVLLGPLIKNTIGKGLRQRVLISFLRDARINFCWDEDAAEAFRLALFHARSDCFNLAGDGALTVHEVGRLLGKKVVHLDRSALIPLAKLAHWFGALSQGEWEWLYTGCCGSLNVSAGKAKEQLGWTPRFDSAGAVREHARSLGWPGAGC